MKKYAAVFPLILLISFLLLIRTEKVNSAFVSAFDDTTVILDAGHGGEDGGAVAFDGTNEKTINLQITKDISAFFDIFGIKYILVRRDDQTLADLTLPSVKDRKISDIRNRFFLIGSVPGSILLSIHQNMFGIEKYYGTQVFYSDSAEGSKEFAECIRSAVVCGLQPDNKRELKTTSGTVYLLDKATHPSVMVECGFLSNFAELEKLKDPIYQSQMAYFITRGVMHYLSVKKDFE